MKHETTKRGPIKSRFFHLAVMEKTAGKNVPDAMQRAWELQCEAEEQEAAQGAEKGGQGCSTTTVPTLVWA
jgi:hypothetical protein